MFPWPSLAFERSKAAIVDAMSNHAEDSTKCVPGQRLYSTDVSGMVSQRFCFTQSPASETKRIISWISAFCGIVVHWLHEALWVESLRVGIEISIAKYCP